MNFRKFYQITGTIVVVFTIVWLAAVMVYLLQTPPSNDPLQQQPPIPEETVQPPLSQPVATAALDHYLVCSYQNTLAVYEVYANGYRVLSRVLDVDISMLRAKDKSAFEEGMVIRDSEALASLVEDFTS